MKKNTEKILKKGYQGTAKLGQAASSIGFVIAVIFGIALIAGGIDLFFVKVPQDPDSPEESNKSANAGMKIAGGIMIGFALLLILFSGLNLYFAKRYKPVAATQGVRAITTLFR